MAKKLSDTNLQNLPACAAEFIKLVIKKMRYRKEVRAEVMAELAGHFEDELADCKTEQDREQKAQRLIAEFGNVKLLAVLLRRAKKRCRPLWRTVAARTFQAAGVLVVCLVVYLAWFFSGKPAVTVDYIAELNKIVRPVADEALNAAPLYRKAAESVENLPDDMKELLSKKYKEATAEQKQLIAKWLTDNEETLELVIAGAQQPYYWEKYEEGKEGEGMLSVVIPHLSGFRRLIYSLRWRIWLSAEQGRYQDAFDDIKSCYRFGQHLRGGKTAVEQLVAIAIESLTVRTIRSILSQHEIDSATLTTLQQDFEQMIADEDFAVNIKTEKLMKYDVIQRCFTEDRLGGGHICLEGFRQCQTLISGEDVSGIASLELFLAKPIHFLFTHPNKQESIKMVDRLYDYWEMIAGKNPWQIQAEGIDVEKEAMQIIKGNMLLQTLLPAYGRVHQLSYRIKADVEAALTMIAILRYRQDFGSYPENLEKLTAAGYFKELPIDPFSDKPLAYKKTDDDFVLYSLGLNCKDDGGEMGVDKDGEIRHWADNGDAIFWPVTE